MVRQRAKSFTVKPECQADFDLHTQTLMQDMVWTGTCRSWCKWFICQCQDTPSLTHEKSNMVPAARSPPSGQAVLSTISRSFPKTGGRTMTGSMRVSATPTGAVACPGLRILGATRWV